MEWLGKRARAKMIHPRKLFLFGRSLGGAVAFHTAELLERSLGFVIDRKTNVGTPALLKISTVFSFGDSQA